MNNINVTDRALASLFYITFGILGFVLLLLGRCKSHFMRFHTFQAILLGILYILIQQAILILFRFVLFLFQISTFPKDSLIQIYQIVDTGFSYLLFGIFAYCIWELWKGKYSWIKYISPQIYKML